MYSWLSRSTLVSTVLLALVGLQSPCLAQWGEPSEAEKKIFAALDSPTVCEFNDTPLAKVLDELQKQHGVKMYIDKRALEEFGISVDDSEARVDDSEASNDPFGLHYDDSGPADVDHDDPFGGPEDPVDDSEAAVDESEASNDPFGPPDDDSGPADVDPDDPFGGPEDPDDDSETAVDGSEASSDPFGLHYDDSGPADVDPDDPSGGPEDPDDGFGPTDGYSGSPIGCRTTLEAKGISLRSALWLILDPHSLTYTIKNGMIAITTQDEAEQTLSTRVYPVDDLIGDDSARSAGFDCFCLMEVIPSVVRPRCWEDHGGLCSIASIPPGNPRSLIVSADLATHEVMREFLGSLRQARSADPKNIPVSIGRPLSAKEKQIVAALKLPTSVSFDDMPLCEAMRSIGKRHDIAIHFDQRALDDLGVPFDSPISRKMDDVPLQDVLRIVLDDLELTYRIENDVLLIGTEDELNQRLDLDIRVYPLANVMPRPRRNFAARDRYMDHLIVTIPEVIDLNSWMAAGGDGIIEPLLLEEFDVLVVLQTPEVHEQIAGLLSRKEFRHAKWVRRVRDVEELDFEALLPRIPFFPHPHPFPSDPEKSDSTKPE